MGLLSVWVSHPNPSLADTLTFSLNAIPLQQGTRSSACRPSLQARRARGRYPVPGDVTRACMPGPHRGLPLRVRALCPAECRLSTFRGLHLGEKSEENTGGTGTKESFPSGESHTQTCLPGTVTVRGNKADTHTDAQTAGASFISRRVCGPESGRCLAGSSKALVTVVARVQASCRGSAGDSPAPTLTHDVAGRCTTHGRALPQEPGQLLTVIVEKIPPASSTERGKGLKGSPGAQGGQVAGPREAHWTAIPQHRKEPLGWLAG